MQSPRKDNTCSARMIAHVPIKCSLNNNSGLGISGLWRKLSCWNESMIGKVKILYSNLLRNVGSSPARHWKSHVTTLILKAPGNSQCRANPWYFDNYPLLNFCVAKLRSCTEAHALTTLLCICFLGINAITQQLNVDFVEQNSIFKSQNTTRDALKLANFTPRMPMTIAMLLPVRPYCGHCLVLRWHLYWRSSYGHLQLLSSCRCTFSIHQIHNRVVLHWTERRMMGGLSWLLSEELAM